MKKEIVTILASVVLLTGCTATDFSKQDAQTIKQVPYEDLCSEYAPTNNMVLNERVRRGVSCDPHDDNCRLELGLKKGTGEYANCVLMMKQNDLLDQQNELLLTQQIQASKPAKPVTTQCSSIGGITNCRSY